jgi:hypothetical protein
MYISRASYEAADHLTWSREKQRAGPHFDVQNRNFHKTPCELSSLAVQCDTYLAGMEITNILAALITERDALNKAIAALEGSGTHRKPGRPVGSSNKRKRVMSAAARAKIAAAARARWSKAKKRGKNSLAA